MYLGVAETMSGTVVWALLSLVHYWFLVLPAGEMTFLYLPTSTEANHMLEDMKVAVLKAGLANQEYRKKQPGS